MFVNPSEEGVAWLPIGPNEGGVALVPVSPSERGVASASANLTDGMAFAY